MRGTNSWKASIIGERQCCKMQIAPIVRLCLLHSLCISSMDFRAKDRLLAVYWWLKEKFQFNVIPAMISVEAEADGFHCLAFCICWSGNFYLIKEFWKWMYVTGMVIAILHFWLGFTVFRVSGTRWRQCMLTFPLTSLSQRTTPWSRSAISWVRSTYGE